MGADLVKIATMANCKEDSSRMLSLYSKHKDIIAFCMGEAGMITRITAPFLGAEFTFASLDDASVTAPGQLSLDKMEKIYDILNVLE